MRQNIKNLAKFIGISILIIPFLTLVKVAFATDLEVPLGTTEKVSGPAEYIHTFIIFGLGLVGVAALAAITYGGFLYLISGGSETRKSEGKDWITGAVWGVLLLFCSYLILNTINPDLVSLKEPGREFIQYQKIDAFTEEDIYAEVSLEDFLEHSVSSTPQVMGQASIVYPESYMQADVEKRQSLRTALSNMPVNIRVTETTGNHGCPNSANPSCLKSIQKEGRCGKSAHCDGRAVDIRTKDLNRAQIKQVLQNLSQNPCTDELFYYDWGPLGTNIGGLRDTYCKDQGRFYKGQACKNHTNHIHWAVFNNCK